MRLTALSTVVFCILAPSIVLGAYENNCNRAAAWLEAHQNVSDGSWGVSDTLKPLATSEAVLALGAYNQRSSKYYAGLTWLENHAAGNLDYKARRLLTMSKIGRSADSEAQEMILAQRMAAPGNKGWGLGPVYNGSPLDTALVLQSAKAMNIAVDSADALGYLKAVQLTGSDKGWALGQSATVDPAATAQVVIAFADYKTQDPTLATPIANAVTTLGVKVTTSSPHALKALAAMAYLADNPNSAAAVVLLNALATSQGTEGDWNGDAYTTALVLHAMSVSMGRDLEEQRTQVDIPDMELRAAINATLNRNALDNLNRGEIAQLSSLDISNQGITDLTGLEWAINLTTLDARNNAIASTAPIDSLNIPNLFLTGNPCPGCTQEYASDGDVPIPAWALLAMGASFVGIANRARRRTQR